MFWDKKGQGFGVGRGARNLGLYIFIGSIIYTFMIFILPESLYFRIILNLIAVIVFFTLMREQAMNRTTLMLIGVVLFFEVVLPMMFSYSYFLRTLAIGPIHIGQWYLSYSWAFMAWFYFALFYVMAGRGGIFTLLRVLVTLFWVFVFINFIMTYLGYFEDMQTGVTLFDQSNAAKNTVLSSIDGFTELFSGAWEGFMGGIDNMIINQRAAFTDAYYVGVVEENEGEKLGVYLEDLTPAQGDFAYDEDIVVYGKVKTRTLDDEVTIDLACYAEDDEDVDMEGEVYPPAAFTIFDLQEEEVDCTIDPRDKRLDLGMTRIIFKVEFNFETIGYLKRYFTDRENLASATREGIDLLDQYEITDKNPQARHTQGPVRLGIGPEQPLIGISETYPVNPRLGITLDSNTDWRGKIEEVKELIVSMPDSMELDLDTCNAEFVTFSISDCKDGHEEYKSRVYNDCKDETDVDVCLNTACTEEFEGYNAYQLNVDHNPHFYQDIEDFISLSCRVKINDYQKVLGGVPINAHYFRARTRYTYSVTDSTSVKLVEPEGGMPPESTMIYLNEEERISDIFREYYYNEPTPLKEFTQAYNVDPCVVMAIISSVSGNNPSELRTDLPKGISKGLMMLTDDEAEDSANVIGISVEDLYYGPTSIQLGTKRLQLITAIPGHGLTKNDLVAEYLGGLEAVEQSTKCATKKKYECSDDDEFAKVEVLVRLVNESMEDCNDLKLVESCGEMADETTGSLFTDGIMILDATGNAPTLSIPLDATTGAELVLDFMSGVLVGDTETSYIFYGSYFESDNTSINSSANFEEAYKISDIVAGKWYYFTNQYLEGNYLPFMRFKFTLNAAGTEVTRLDYQFLNRVVINSPTIFEIEPTDLREPVALIDDVIYVQYVDEWGTFLGIEMFRGWNPLNRQQMLVFSYNDNDDEKIAFYAAPWPMEVTCVDSNVEEDDTPGVFGLVLRNKERGQELVGLDYTSFQFDFDPSKQLIGQAAAPPGSGGDGDDDVEEIEVDVSDTCITNLMPYGINIRTAGTDEEERCQLMAMLATESCGVPDAAAPTSSARGIAQIVPDTAATKGLCNPAGIPSGAGDCDVANGGFDNREIPALAIPIGMILLREEHEAFKAAGYTHWEDYGSGGYNTGRGCMGRIIGKATTDFGDNPDWNHVAHVIEEDDVVYCFCSGRTASGCGRGLDSSGGKAAKIKEMREYPVKIREYKQICLDNNLMS